MIYHSGMRHVFNFCALLAMLFQLLLRPHNNKKISFNAFEKAFIYLSYLFIWNAIKSLL